jgi:hypothetical protein
MDVVYFGLNGFENGFVPLNEMENAQQALNTILEKTTNHFTNATLRIRFDTKLSGFLKEQVFKQEKGKFDKLDVKNFLFPYFHRRKEFREEERIKKWGADSDFHEIEEKIKYMSHENKMKLSLILLQSFEQDKQ